MGIRQKFVLSVLLGVAAFVFVFVLSLREQHQAVLDAYTARNRSVVSLAMSLLQGLESRRQAGEFDLATAQAKGRELIDHLRYDGGEYLFVLGNDGRMVVNPARPELVGFDMLKFRDDNGNPLAELVAQALKNGEGAAHYTLTRITGGKPLDKVAYVASFRPWGWLVGTGVYVEDAETAFVKSAQRFVVVATPVGLLLLAAIFWLARSVASPMRDLSQAVDAIKSRRFLDHVPHTERTDELGQMARAVASLQQVTVMEDEVRKVRDLIVTVFDASQEAALICDGAGTVLFASPAMCRLSGYPAERLRGQPMAILYSGHQDEDFFATIAQQVDRVDFWEGDVWNRRANGEVFVVHQRQSVIRDAAGRIVNKVVVMNDVVEHGRRQKGQRYLPQHDPLTNLADAMLLSKRLERMLAQASRSGRPVAMLVMDVDGFRRVNDQLGMVGGDEALRFLALRLMKAVRTSDTVARLGGNQYAVLMEDFAGMAEVQAVADHIVESMRPPQVVAGRSVVVTVSLGIVQAPHDGRGEERLLRAAREAVARAKAQGGDRSVWASGFCELVG